MTEIVVGSPTRPACENATVTTADGRVFNLGRPGSLMFKLRLALCKWRRRRELKNG